MEMVMHQSFAFGLFICCRKLFASVLSCRFASSRLYATKYLLVLLRIGVKKSRNFQHWVIEMLINQLYDENQTIAMIALNLLNEASDYKVSREIIFQSHSCSSGQSPVCNSPFSIIDETEHRLWSFLFSGLS